MHFNALPFTGKEFRKIRERNRTMIGNPIIAVSDFHFHVDELVRRTSNNVEKFLQ